MNEDSQERESPANSKRRIFSFRLHIFISEIVSLIAAYTLVLSIFSLFDGTIHYFTLDKSYNSDNSVLSTFHLVFLLWLCGSLISSFLAVIIAYRKESKNMMKPDKDGQTR
jgi:ABC-type phosphate transport system permease subunit